MYIGIGFILVYPVHSVWSVNVKKFIEVTLGDSRIFSGLIYIPVGYLVADYENKIACEKIKLNILTLNILRANWTFILWGGIYGFLIILNRLFEKAWNKILKPVRWFFTFIIVDVLWLLFRSDSIGQWIQIINKVFHIKSISISDALLKVFETKLVCFMSEVFHINKVLSDVKYAWMAVYLIVAIGICLIPKNNYNESSHFTFFNMILAGVAFVCGIICLGEESVFVYLNF